MVERFSNDSSTTLTAAITAVQTTLAVSSVAGFPAPNFRIRIDNEILLVTAGPPGSTTWTVTRGSEGTTATTHNILAPVSHILTAGGLAQALAEAMAAGTGVVRLDTQVGTGASGILAFTAIAPTYRKLAIDIMGRSDAAALTAVLRVTVEASPTAGAYNRQRLLGNAAAVTASEDIGANDFIQITGIPGATAVANVYGGAHIELPEYANTGFFKIVSFQELSAFGTTTGTLQTGVGTGLIELTAAVSTVRLILSSGNWTTLSRATLYGWP